MPITAIVLLIQVCYEGRSGSGSTVSGGQQHGVKVVAGGAKAQLPEQQDGGGACPQQLIFVGSQEALLRAAEVTAATRPKSWLFHEHPPGTHESPFMC